MNSQIFMLHISAVLDQNIYTFKQNAGNHLCLKFALWPLDPWNRFFFFFFFKNGKKTCWCFLIPKALFCIWGDFRHELFIQLRWPAHHPKVQLSKQTKVHLGYESWSAEEVFNADYKLLHFFWCLLLGHIEPTLIGKLLYINGQFWLVIYYTIKFDKPEN